MKSAKQKSIALCLLLTISGAYAQPDIRGAVACGTWVKSRQDGPTATIYARGWLLGYLSGKSSANGLPGILKTTPPESLYLWIDNYCKSNPLKDTDDAAEPLFLELLKKRQ